MRFVKAAKASPHAKFYNLSTAYKYKLISPINYDIDTIQNLFSTGTYLSSLRHNINGMKDSNSNNHTYISFFMCINTTKWVHRKNAKFQEKQND